MNYENAWLVNFEARFKYGFAFGETQNIYSFILWERMCSAVKYNGIRLLARIR